MSVPRQPLFRELLRRMAATSYRIYGGRKKLSVGPRFVPSLEAIGTYKGSELIAISGRARKAGGSFPNAATMSLPS
jgi:hypothetical protein